MPGGFQRTSSSPLCRCSSPIRQHLIDPAMVEHQQSDSQMILPTLVLAWCHCLPRSCFSVPCSRPSRAALRQPCWRPRSRSGKHPQAHGRPPALGPQAAVDDAHGDAVIHPDRHLLRDALGCQHLQDGGKRVNQITLVSAFVPLVFGIYWRRATNQGRWQPFSAASACGYQSSSLVAKTPTRE